MDTLLAFFIGLVSGIIYYFFDFKRLKSWYRKWYGITHKNPLPANADQSFVYGQPFSGKLFTAIFLAIIITLIIIFTGSDNIIIQGLYGLFITLGLMVSFYIAPFLFRHGPSKMGKLKQTLDDIDQLEKKLVGDEKADSIEIEAKAEPLPAEPKEEKTAESPKEKKKDDDWRSGIKDYLND